MHEAVMLIMLMSCDYHCCYLCMGAQVKSKNLPTTNMRSRIQITLKVHSFFVLSHKMQ
jgi:hypothetical protein